MLIPPYRGSLVDLVALDEEREALVREAADLPSIQLSPRSLCDLELLAVGAFSPLARFMGRADYERVVEEMRLQSGVLFPLPVTLPSSDARRVRLDSRIALRSPRNDLLAVMTVEEAFEFDDRREAALAYGTTDARHPLVSEMASWGRTCLSGAVRVVRLPSHYDFIELRRIPAQVRQTLSRLGYRQVIAFQTRNPMHRAHEELTKRAAEQAGAALLIHPVVGMTRPGDVDHYTRVRAYRALVDRYYDRSRTLLALIPLAMRMAGPREAVWHALIRRNYGASHFIVGRDHASPGADSAGRPFYGPYDAQTLLKMHEAELGITMVPFQEFVYLPDEQRYEERDRVAEGARIASISGTAVREEYLATGVPLPAWFTRPEIADILGSVWPPQYQRGVCLWFTGLSGAGKSTIAEILVTLLMEHGRQVTLLDGDVVRTHLSKGLGFSKDDRDTNIRRIGFVAAEIARHNGVVICAAVSPYRTTRNECRMMVGSDRFIEIFVDTPMEVCERRDVKGMYAKARRGEITGFTGIDDPYETPVDPEIWLDTVGRTAEENARAVVEYLVGRGFVRDAAVDAAAVAV